MSFQITFTDQEQVIVAESSGAFTAEAANLIDANTIRTDSWDFLTFINVWKWDELVKLQYFMALHIACILNFTVLKAELRSSF